MSERARTIIGIVFGLTAIAVIFVCLVVIGMNRKPDETTCGHAWRTHVVNTHWVGDGLDSFSRNCADYKPGDP